MLLGSVLPAKAATTHYWTGGSASSSYWSSSANWESSDPPEGDGTEILYFSGHRARLQNTNNFLPLPPATFITYRELHIDGGGYALYGNPLKLGLLQARYEAGTNSTVYFDLREGASISVSSNNSSLTLAGDLILTNGSLYVRGAGDCVIRGVISGDGSVIKDFNAYGDLEFSGLGANTYTGDTSVRDGVLRLDRYRLVGLTRVGTVAVPGDLTIGTGTNSVASDLVVLERSGQITDTSRVTVFGSGLVQFVDADLSANPQRFYRIVSR